MSQLVNKLNTVSDDFEEQFLENDTKNECDVNMMKSIC